MPTAVATTIGPEHNTKHAEGKADSAQYADEYQQTVQGRTSAQKHGCKMLTMAAPNGLNTSQN